MSRKAEEAALRVFPEPTEQDRRELNDEEAFLWLCQEQRRRRKTFIGYYEQFEKDYTWRSCKDELPEIGDLVLTCTDGGGSPKNISLSIFSENGWVDEENNTIVAEYWMPIPEELNI